MDTVKYGAWSKEPAPISSEQIICEFTADVIIAGAGIAGVSCALRAAECGADVIVCEKSSSWSGRGGNIGVANSAFMRSQGYTNDPDAVAREWIKRSCGRCNERIVRRYLKESPRAMDWLIDIITRPDYAARPALQGSIYKGETYRELYGSHRFFGGPMEKKGMRSGGADAVNAMYGEAVKLGVRFLFNTPVVRLIKDDGRVCGAIAGSEGGFTRITARRGVVLATGDIGGSDEMCEDLAPLANRCAQKLYWPKGGNTGDGHRLGLWAGGSFEDAPFPLMVHPQAYHYRTYCFLFVKPDGTRFMNEDTYVQGKTVAILREREKYIWSIMCADWRERVQESLPYGGGLFWGGDCLAGESEFKLEDEERMLQMGIEHGVVVTADTPAGLADKMGVPADEFENTLRRYNEQARAGHDEDFGKRRELLFPLDKAPYYGMKVGTALLAVVGGLRVDSHMRCLDEGSRAVPGLYAIGNASGGRYGVDYPVIIPGNSHGTALTFGFLLGEELGCNDKTKE